MVTTRLRTAQDLWQMGDSGEDAELIDGELISMVPPGGDHGFIQLTLGSILRAFVTGAKLGRVYGEVGYVLRRNPDTVLAPNVSFVAQERLPADQTRFIEIAPDLAVEIVSPGNNPGEIERKLAIYLSAGVRQVWIVYPKLRQVAVYKPGNDLRLHSNGQDIDCAPELSGLIVPVSLIVD